MRHALFFLGLLGLQLLWPWAAHPARSPAPRCENTSLGLVPLPELGPKHYRGFQGGLYPGGANVPPESYIEEGLIRADSVQPRDPSGAVDENGRIVLLSIGMSNTTQEFNAFMKEAKSIPGVNARLTLVDGAQGGQDTKRMLAPGTDYWSYVDAKLRQAGVTAQQVQVIWLKQAIAGIRGDFPSDAVRLQNDLRTLVATLAKRFPNLQIIYLSSRTYAGYAVTPLNPEPYAYQSGFAVKWLIEERIRGDISGPWLSWGPYLWVDGTRPRNDGFTWTCADVASDGTHPSEAGRRKVGTQLSVFFQTDPTARVWFLGPPSSQDPVRIKAKVFEPRRDWHGNSTTT